MSTDSAPTPPEGLPPPPFSILPSAPPVPPALSGEAMTAPLPVAVPHHAAPGNPVRVLAFAALVISLLAVTVAAFGWALSHPVNPQGPAGPQGVPGPRGHNHVILCIRYDPATGNVANITVPVGGACGPSSVLIRVP